MSTSAFSRKPLPLALLSVLLTLLTLGATVASAQQSGVVGQTEREIRIIQERSNWARTQIAKAQSALAENDFESAYALSKSAVDALPSGGDALKGLRPLALETFSKSALMLAEQRISEGRFEDAQLVVSSVTGSPYESQYAPLLALERKLHDPKEFNKTVTPAFVSKVEEVKQLLSEAKGCYARGSFDKAFRIYSKVLNLDPENTSARLGMEEVNRQRTTYAETAYNEQRSKMIEDVSRAWELPVTKFDTGASTIIEQNPIDVMGTSSITRKLQEIRIEKLVLQDDSVREAIAKLQKKSRDLDTGESDPTKKGVNIVLKLDPAKESADGGTRISLALNDLPLGEALKYVASAANLKVKVEPYAAALVPLSEPSEVLISKEYKVPPGFISSSPTPAAKGGDPSKVGQTGAKDFLQAQGVTFPTGASATYLASSSRLLMKNTQSNLDLIDSLVEVAQATPPSQVEIEARFLEITQNNLQELGFDWLMGSFQLPGGTGAYGGGGTVGNQANQPVSSFPFVNPATGLPTGAMNASGGNVTAGNITAGNRTGAAGISANALDSLLFGSPVGPAPGVLALAGVFTNPQFQVVLRALNQQKGVDLVSAPKVTVTSGRKATININRKFPYPKDYAPPQIPQTQFGGGGVATPATPTSFETRKVGVQLEVEPTIGPDGYTIELSLSPQIVEFEGMVNYGTPISAVAPYKTIAGASLGLTAQIILTKNPILQPIFSVRQVDTQVTVQDGQTVVLGGLMREDVQKVEDKTPIMGDLPLVGSLFRSSDNQRIKRNLLIFVTAGLLDPAGQPLIRQDDESSHLAPDATAIRSEAVPGDASTSTQRSR